MRGPLQAYIGINILLVGTVWLDLETSFIKTPIRINKLGSGFSCLKVQKPLVLIISRITLISWCTVLLAILRHLFCVLWYSGFQYTRELLLMHASKSYCLVIPGICFCTFTFIFFTLDWRYDHAYNYCLLIN